MNKQAKKVSKAARKLSKTNAEIQDVEEVTYGPQFYQPTTTEY
jgi:hypothetical protein